jgi:uncharacterized protein (TIGR03086 family)
MSPDLGPAARALADLLVTIEDGDLDRPTPCPEWTVRDLLGHVAGIPQAFAGAARKQPVPPDGEPVLPEGWRASVPGDLAAMAEAWRDPEAWGGMTQVGGIDLPGEVCGLIGLDELVVHGWDLHVATGPPWSVDDGTLGVVEGFLAGFEVPADVDEGPFGAPVPVAADAPLLDRVVAKAGRSPGWRP